MEKEESELRMLLSKFSVSSSPFYRFYVFICPLREVLFSFFLYSLVKFVNAYKTDIEDDDKLCVSEFLFLSVVLFFVLVFLSLLSMYV